MDTGNLVLRRESGEVLWQSVEHPTDTWLPGARLGVNKITGDVLALVSWKNAGDPAPGMFTLRIDPNGSSQYLMIWNRTVTSWSSGEWNGDVYAGVPEMTSHYKYDFQFVNDTNGTYFTCSLQDPTGDLQDGPGRLRPDQADHVGAVRRRVDDHLGGAAPAVRRLRRLRCVRRLQREERALLQLPPRFPSLLCGGLGARGSLPWLPPEQSLAV